MRKLIALSILLALSGCTANSGSVVLEGVAVDLRTDAPAQSSPKPLNPDYVADPEAELEIEDQSGDGRVVVIREISVQRAAAFVVIYNSDLKVISTQAISPRSKAVNLILEPNLTRSQQLQAAVYLDNGDGVFNLELDAPVVDDEGELLHEDFYYEVVQ